MKNVILLLVVVGLLVAGWRHRDKLTGMLKKPGSGEVAEEGSIFGSSVGEPPVEGATKPHPAKEAQIAATKAYPALGIPNSAFNKKFLALYAEAQRSEPQLLAQSDWPLKLADRTAVALGGAPMPVPQTPAPVQASGLQGSALDKRPKK